MSLFISRVRNLSSPCFLLSDKMVKESGEGVVTTSEKKLPKEVIGQTLFGSSQGWVASMDSKDLPVNLTDLYKPLVSSPRVIPLPSLGFYSRPFTTELSLSSSCPDQNQEDFTVAAKFCGTHLSVCLASLPLSSCIPRETKPSISSVKGLYMGSLHLSNMKKKKIRYQEVRLCNFPKIPGEMLDRCFTSKHLVESPSGDLFLVKYAQCSYNTEDQNGEAEGIHSKTKRFMVFREDEKRRYFSYTEDIGDLCIVLSKGEALCVSSSMYPGLKPNSIYYIGHGLGSYDLASGTVYSFEPLGATMLNHAPFWIHSII
ncbi:hypothetical protein Bca52824_022779 [Brassica carinata]|uniref:KIB1-4 beta-propeller domain-containing protein n=1 Tax=Brassica carinata TaxID=52824 RepID=A0A8X7VHC5_BRACI|nr:hypothetical protein Bca52824_022779 [Brassica carinata]